MEFFRFKERTKRASKDGKRYIEAIFRKKTRKYGEVLSDINIPRGKSLLLVGPHGSGKSYALKRFAEKWDGIYRTKCNTVIYFSAVTSLSQWVAAAGLSEWYEDRDNGLDAAETWARVLNWKKQDLLATFVEEKKALLIVDDVDKLSGKKLQIVRDCLLVAPLFVCSAFDEGSIKPSLRTSLLRSDPFILRLSSDVAYDITKPFMWIFVFLLSVMGAHEAALISGGLLALSSGRRAAKQD